MNDRVESRVEWCYVGALGVYTRKQVYGWHESRFWGCGVGGGDCPDNQIRASTILLLGEKIKKFISFVCKGLR